MELPSLCLGLCQSKPRQASALTKVFLTVRRVTKNYGNILFMFCSNCGCLEYPWGPASLSLGGAVMSNCSEPFTALVNQVFE